MASEFFAEGGSDVAVALTPGVAGVLTVYMDGDKIFDRKDEGGDYPSLPRVKEMRVTLRERIDALKTAVAV